MTLLPFDYDDPYVDDTVPWVGRAALVVGTLAVTAGALTVAGVVFVVDKLVRRGRR